MLTIDRYIMQRFMAGVLLVLLLLLALFSFLALGEELGDVGKGQFMLPDALLVVVLTTPKRILELLPVTALLGGLMGLGAMANNRELIAIRAVGMSKRRIALTVTGLTLLLALAMTILQFTVVPAFEREASQLRTKAVPGTASKEGPTRAFWTRNGAWFIRVNDVLYDQRLADIEIYTTDRNDRLTQIVTAKSADYAGDNNWLLTDVQRTDLKYPQVVESTQKSVLWKDLLSEEQAGVLMLPLEALAPNDLFSTIRNMKHNHLDTQRYEIAFWQQVSLLPGLLSMALLSLPFLLGSVRTVSAGQRTVIGGMFGIGFYLVQQLAGHLAGVFDLNPMPVILSPSLLLLALAIVIIRRQRA